ncbi:hypothetical protein NA644_01700 [Pseudomonas stutzeri]|nr:hypothetical protein [Stutzerimonas stutzeri]MCQ4248012.1 hypothetical protein [Stutzerimonas stutzeri]
MNVITTLLVFSQLLTVIVIGAVVTSMSLFDSSGSIHEPLELVGVICG